jgi:DHA1 family bicyclomycin/chloramphenicol resistance-like MFS transporter
MPAIAHSMAVDPGTLGITLGIFTIGTAFGQIIFGPISDKFGRKPVVIFGLSLYIVAAFLASYSSNVEELSFIRFIQGIGAASGRIIGIAIVRDMYAKEKAARLLSNIWMVSAVMPILNPFIGSTLLHYFSWGSVFIFMAIFAAIITIITILFFKETSKYKDTNALNPRQLLQNFSNTFKNPAFIFYMLIGSISMSSLYAFLATSADLLITQLNQAPSTFAWQFAIVGCGSLAGSFISSRLSMRLGIHRVIRIGIFITSISSIIFFLLSVNGIFSAVAIIIPFTIQRIGEAMISAQSMAGAISPFPKNAGVASSLLGFIRQLTGATVAILAGYFANGTTMPMACAFIFAGITPAIIFILFRRNIS